MTAGRWSCNKSHFEWQVDKDTCDKRISTCVVEAAQASMMTQAWPGLAMVSSGYAMGLAGCVPINVQAKRNHFEEPSWSCTSMLCDHRGPASCTTIFSRVPSRHLVRFSRNVVALLAIRRFSPELQPATNKSRCATFGAVIHMVSRRTQELRRQCARQFQAAARGTDLLAGSGRLSEMAAGAQPSSHHLPPPLPP